MATTLTSQAAAVLERYQARTPRSAALYDRARESLPAGTTRSLNSWRPYPTYIEAGHGVGVRGVDEPADDQRPHARLQPAARLPGQGDPLTFARRQDAQTPCQCRHCRPSFKIL